MAKNTAPARNPAAKIDFELPAGMEEVSTDIVGFWTQENVIQCYPLNIKLFDSELDEIKPSILITVRLKEDLECIKSAKEGHEPVLAKAGDLVGIWARPGLAALAKCRDIFTIIVPNGDKDTGKKDPMKMFRVIAEKGAEKRRLQVEDDFREKSLRTKTRWIPESYNSAAPQRSGKARPEYSDNNGYSGDEDDINFDE